MTSGRTLRRKAGPGQRGAATARGSDERRVKRMPLLFLLLFLLLLLLPEVSTPYVAGRQPIEDAPLADERERTGALVAQRMRERLEPAPHGLGRGCGSIPEVGEGLGNMWPKTGVATLAHLHDSERVDVRMVAKGEPTVFEKNRPRPDGRRRARRSPGGAARWSEV